MAKKMSSKIIVVESEQQQTIRNTPSKFITNCIIIIYTCLWNILWVVVKLIGLRIMTE